MSRSTVAAVLAIVAAAAGVARTQPRLAKAAHAVKEADEVYPLPPPGELRVATLGWRSATVDLLWADLLVTYGTHWQEKRAFTAGPDYLNAILALEPDYFPVYKYVGTLLAYRPLQGTEDDVRTARTFLERGTRERPDDSRVWIEYGQFIAFIAPSFLKQEADQKAWRKDGAVAMAHAVSLGADADNSLTAASMLSRAGERSAAIRYLRQAYAFTEHPSMGAIHQAIAKRLAALQSSVDLQTADNELQAIEARWQRELPSVERDRYMLLGPLRDAARCAGVRGYGGAGCTRPECCAEWQDILAPVSGLGPSASSP